MFLYFPATSIIATPRRREGAASSRGTGVQPVHFIVRRTRVENPCYEEAFATWFLFFLAGAFVAPFLVVPFFDKPNCGCRLPAPSAIASTSSTVSAKWNF